MGKLTASAFPSQHCMTENSAINNTVYNMIADNKMRWEQATGGMGGMEQMAVWVAILSNAILTVIIIGLVSKNYYKSKKLEGEVKGLGGGQYQASLGLECLPCTLNKDWGRRLLTKKSWQADPVNRHFDLREIHDESWTWVIFPDSTPTRFTTIVR